MNSLFNLAYILRVIFCYCGWKRHATVKYRTFWRHFCLYQHPQKLFSL